MVGTPEPLTPVEDRVLQEPYIKKCFFFKKSLRKVTARAVHVKSPAWKSDRESRLIGPDPDTRCIYF